MWSCALCLTLQSLAMSMAMPVIATNWSGPTAYLTPSTAYPLPVRDLEPAAMAPGMRWAAVDTAALQMLMGHVATHRAEARAVGAAARVDIVRRFDQRIVAQDFLRLVQSACRTRQRRLQARADGGG